MKIPCLWYMDCFGDGFYGLGFWCLFWTLLGEGLEFWTRRIGGIGGLEVSAFFFCGLVRLLLVSGVWSYRFCVYSFSQNLGWWTVVGWESDGFDFLIGACCWLGKHLRLQRWIWNSFFLYGVFLDSEARLTQIIWLHVREPFVDKTIPCPGRVVFSRVNRDVAIVSQLPQVMVCIPDNQQQYTPTTCQRTCVFMVD